MDLKDLESKIKGLARRYAKNDNEDLEQIARIAVWQTLEKESEASNSYYLKAAEWAILNYIQKKKAQKRGGNITLISFHKHDEEEVAPEDFVAGYNEITSMEKMEVVRSSLKEKFGSHYFKKLKKQKKLSISANIVRTLVEDVWKIKKEDIPERINRKLFEDYGMKKFLLAFYQDSYIKAIQDAYPGIFFRWELNDVPLSFWQGEEGYNQAVEATRWLCKKYGYEGKGRCPVGLKEFKKEGLERVLALHFQYKPHLALRAALPNLRAWQAKQVPKGYFESLENQRIAVDELLQDLGIPSFSQLSSEEIFDHSRKIRKHHFEERGLTGLIHKYHGSPYALFSALYPGKLYPWFFYSRRKKMSKEEAVAGIKWLFENYLQIEKEEIPRYATLSTLSKFGLGTGIHRGMKLRNSSYDIINLAYPHQFSPDEFSGGRRTVSVHKMRAAI